MSICLAAGGTDLANEPDIHRISVNDALVIEKALHNGPKLRWEGFDFCFSPLSFALNVKWLQKKEGATSYT